MPTHRNTRAHTHTCTHCAYAKLLFCIAHHTMPDSPAGLRREDHVLKLLLSHWILQNASFLYTVISYVQLGTLTQKTIGTTDKLFLFDQIWILCFFTPNNSNIFWIYLKKTLLTQSYEMKQINSPQIHFYVKYEFQIRRRTYTYSCIITRQDEDILPYIWTPLLISEKKSLNRLFSASFYLLTIPPVSSKTVSQRLRFCAKPEPCVIMWVKVALCAIWSRIVWESLLLRVEVVAQVLESAAGEMLSAAGKNHCQEGRERMGAVCAGQDIKQPTYTVRASVALIKYDRGLILLHKCYYYIDTVVSLKWYWPALLF